MSLDLVEHLKKLGGLVYLATPYSLYFRGLDAAAEDATFLAAELLRRGVIAYSPVAYTHQLAQHGFNARDREFWLAYDETMMKKADVLLVGCLTGWSESDGIREEIEWFKRAGKPYYYWEADCGGLEAAPRHARGLSGECPDISAA